MSLIEFKGRVYDTDKTYMFGCYSVVRVLSSDDREMKVSFIDDGDTELVSDHLKEITLSEPERPKIVPEDRKAYHIKDIKHLRQNEFITWWLDDMQMFGTSHRLEDVEIICEMVEKVCDCETVENI